MENRELNDLVKKFDNFVHFSLTRKDAPDPLPPQPENKVETYLTEMEKRLKLRPRSHNQRFENLLKPMKDLKSFVSVKEFMESLGTCAVGKMGDKNAEREEKSIKLQYQNLRGGYYLQKIEEHLRNKKFKRSARNHPCFATELDNNTLETSEYRTWVEGALGKISLKNDQFFKKTEGRIREGREKIEHSTTCLIQKDCLMEEHQKEYADQFKVVPRIREMCNQEYENFSKITTLLTGRLRKILKNNCGDRKSATLKDRNGVTIANPPNEGSDKRNTTKRYMEGKRTAKENSSRAAAKKTRVQTAGTKRREQCEIWRECMNDKLQKIINVDSSEFKQQ